MLKLNNIFLCPTAVAGVKFYEAQLDILITAKKFPEPDIKAINIFLTLYFDVLFTLLFNF